MAGTCGMKHGMADPPEGERKNKQAAIFDDEEELSALFDRVLLCAYSGVSASSHGTRHQPISQKFNVGCGTASATTACTKKKASRRSRNAVEVIDLSSLLNLCARAMTEGNWAKASERIAEIRKHSSPYGSGAQRFAHYFVEAAEARLNGRGSESYGRMVFQKPPLRDDLTNYRLFSLTPYRKFAQHLASYHILKVAEGASTLHIIDFGIMHGFQWPPLIKTLSSRFGNVLKLRITGIETPDSGFRPGACTEAAGRLLANYCERFNVPFEYEALVKDWHMIKPEDFIIGDNETIVVNCFYRFRRVSVQAGERDNCRRDAIFRMIRDLNPHIFVYAIINRSLNACMFPSRVREAMFSFSNLFDMLDSITCSDDGISYSDRLAYERNDFATEVMNVIACEGHERIETPETYRGWHARSVAAGFQPLPLNPDLVRGLSKVIKSEYHKEFSAYGSDPWLLMTWKGRITNGVSCWTPAVAPPGVLPKKTSS